MSGSGASSSKANSGHGTSLPLQIFVFVLLREVLAIVSSTWTQCAEFSTLCLTHDLTSVVPNGHLNAQFTSYSSFCIPVKR